MAAENRRAAMAEQRAKQIALDKVSRIARKSPIDGLDMQCFFGVSIRPKATIDLLSKTDERKPAKKPHTTGTSRVTNLPNEVLENMLSHLPIFDLIVATGVSLSFRDAVQNSPTLQRKLFLRATNEPTQYVTLRKKTESESPARSESDDYYDDEHDTDWELEDMEAHTLEFVDGNCKSDSDHLETDNTDSESANGYGHDLPTEPKPGSIYAVAVLCPFLLGSCWRYRTVKARLLFDEGEKVYFSKITVLAEHWANMYLTNPPCTKITVHLEYNGGHEYIISADRIIYCETGITLALLLNVMHTKGDVKVTRGYREDEGPGFVGPREHTTAGRVLADYEEHREHRNWQLGDLELDLSRTVIKFPHTVFREWRANRDSGYHKPLDQEEQVVAEDEILQ
jgi:hypothetical protein